MRNPIFTIRKIENNFEISESRISHHNGFFHFREASHPEGNYLVGTFNFEINFYLVFGGTDGGIGECSGESSVLAGDVSFRDHLVEEGLIAQRGDVGARVDQRLNLGARDRGVEVWT